jgi:hypothetical protein
MTDEESKKVVFSFGKKKLTLAAQGAADHVQRRALRTASG